MTTDKECNTDKERHLSMQDVADRFGVPLQTVRVWRLKGTGPRGMAVGKYVRYRLSDVLAWEESRLDEDTTEGKGSN